MKFTYTPSFADFWALNVHVLRKQFRFVIWIAAALVAMFLISPFLDLSRQPRSAGDAYFSNLGVLVLPAIVGLTFVATYWTAKKRWAAAEELREEREYTFDERGVRVHSKSVDSFVEWKILKEATITKKLFFLRTGQRQFHYFPLQVVPNLEELRELVRAKVGSIKNA